MGFLFVNFWGRNPLSFGRSWIMSRQAVGEGGRLGGGRIGGGGGNEGLVNFLEGSEVGVLLLSRKGSLR